jgi:hypothetical protein
MQISLRDAIWCWMIGGHRIQGLLRTHPRVKYLHFSESASEVSVILLTLINFCCPAWRALPYTGVRFKHRTGCVCSTCQMHNPPTHSSLRSCNFVARIHFERRVFRIGFDSQTQRGPPRTPLRRVFYRRLRKKQGILCINSDSQTH